LAAHDVAGPLPTVSEYDTLLLGTLPAAIGSVGEEGAAVDQQKTVDRFRADLRTVLTIRLGLRYLLVWLMLWAAVGVLARVALRAEQSLLLWGLVGVAPAVVAAVVAAGKKTPSVGVLRAVLDRHGRLGGLLMAAGDGDIGQWGRQIPHAVPPLVRWRFGRQAVLLLSALAFLAAGFLIPDRYLPLRPESLEIGQEVQKLSEKLAVLQQAEVLPPEKAQSLQQDLERIRQAALGSDPAKTMEAIDHLERSFAQSAAEAAEAAIQQTEKTARAEELADALQKLQEKMDAKQLGEAMKELGRFAEEAAAEDRALSDALSEELKEACKRGDLTGEQLRELSEALAKSKECQQGKVAKLVKARLVDPAASDRIERAGECDGEALALALGDCQDGQALIDALQLPDGDGLPGRGAATRGRGDAAMTWSQGANKENVEFKEQVLNAGAVASLKASRLAGVSTGLPAAENPGGGSAGGALGAAPAGSGAAQGQLILPEHEKAVRRYFERGKK
jgi:hypothetical protein